MGEMNFKNRGELVFETLKREILDLRLKPGQMISENEICDRFGVSRTPVRDALRLLQEQGFAETIPYRGTYVTLLSLDNIKQMIYMRVAVETMVLRDFMQNRAMYAIHFLAYAVMYLKTENDGVRLMLIAFYVAQVVFFLCYIYLYRFLYRNVSRLLVNNTCMLLCVGFIMLSRLSLDKGLDKAVRQYVIVVISACLAWAIPYIMERVWQLYKLQWLYAGVGILVLFTVYAAGNESFGAQLSLTIGGISIQPSEFVKLTFVFFTASMFYQSTDFRAVAAATAVAAVHVLIMVLS